MTNNDECWPFSFDLTSPPLSLPTGALTLVEVGESEFSGLWGESVGRLLQDLEARDRPALLVTCDDPEPGEAAAVAALYASPKITTFADEDVLVWAPLPSAGQDGERVLAYAANVPTIVLLAQPLQELEASFGPAAVILDDVTRARPYWAAHATDPELTLPKGFALDRWRADAWRAEDLLAFAQTRVSAPTVVVWYWRDNDLAAVRALRELASLRVVMSERGTRAVALPEAGGLRLIPDDVQGA